MGASYSKVDFHKVPSVWAAIRSSAAPHAGPPQCHGLARWACCTPSPEAPTRHSLRALPSKRKEAAYVRASPVFARPE